MVLLLPTFLVNPWTIFLYLQIRKLYYLHCLIYWFGEISYLSSKIIRGVENRKPIKAFEIWEFKGWRSTNLFSFWETKKYQSKSSFSQSTLWLPMPLFIFIWFCFNFLTCFGIITSFKPPFKPPIDHIIRGYNQDFFIIQYRNSTIV